MDVLNYLLKKMDEETLHMGLIDPDEQSPEKSAELAMTLEEIDSDAVMVGGSTGITKKKLDHTVEAMKERVDIPIIHFPTEAGHLSSHFDAIYFMSMLNSKDLDKVIGQQVKGAPLVKMMDIQPLSMGYVIIEPGMAVGDVGNADLIPRDDPEKVMNFALAAQYLGMELFYIEAGSGAPEPAPTEMVEMCDENVDIPLIIGGGIREPEKAVKLKEAGADVIVTGTVLEEALDVDKIEKLVRSIKE